MSRAPRPLGWSTPPRIITPAMRLASGLDGYGMGLVSDHAGFGYLSGVTPPAPTIFARMEHSPYHFGEAAEYHVSITTAAVLTGVSLPLILSPEPYWDTATVFWDASGGSAIGDWSVASAAFRPSANGYYDFVASASINLRLQNVNPIGVGTTLLRISFGTTVNLNTSRHPNCTIAGATTYAASDTLPSSTEYPAGTWTIVVDPSPPSGMFLTAVGTEAASVV